jgi:hypothetical protein
MGHPAIVVLVASLALASCTGAEDPERALSPSASPSRTSVPATTRAQLPTDPSASWRVLKQWRRDGTEAFGDYNGTYTSFRESSSDIDTPQHTRVFAAGGRLVLDRASQGAGWFSQEAWLTGHFAVVEDINNEKRLVRLFVYDLKTTKPVQLPGGLQPTQPEVDVGFGMVSFTTGTAKGRMCQQLIDLESGVTKATACVITGDLLGDSVIGAENHAFSQVRASNTDQRCKDLVVMEAGRRTELPLRQKCLGWSAALIAGAVAWDEADPFAENLVFGDGYVLPDGGELVSLGSIFTDSIVGCGNRFFWQGTGPDQSIGIASWDAEHGVQTVWGPEGNIVPTALGCSDGRWLHSRLDDNGGKDEKLRFAVLDTSRLS